MRSELTIQPHRDSNRASATTGATASGAQTAQTSSGAHIAKLTAELCELRADLEQVRAERNRLAETQRRIMELLDVKSPDRLLHDIRNVLNERQLLRALTAQM
ncbi:MAG TPA: hypothetical protein VK797_06015 [Tepidisphaeraceae bacterium]|jgi:hypothetical protein|nr:hypothetical protein [Tepidisphaeraceae bacterium]